MRILITGGGGLLGSKLTSIATYRGHETFSGYTEHEAQNGIPIKLDITTNVRVKEEMKSLKPEVVVHAAALTNVDKCEENMDLAWKVNVEGTKNIVDSSERHNAFFIYISTDYIFSGKKGNYKETDKPNPINNYGITKLEAEELVKASTLNWCIARPSVIYGATPAAGKINFALWVLTKLQKSEPLNIITDQWISPTLNTSLANMIMEIIENKITGIYHLAGATPMNRFNFAMLLAETFFFEKTLITPIKSSEMKWLANRPINTSLNVRKASLNLKCKPFKIQKALQILKKEMRVQSTEVKM